LSAIAVSAALHVSSVPWDGPISTMRVGYIKHGENGESAGGLILNPTDIEKQNSKLDLVVSSTLDKVLMIETEAQMIDDDIIKDGIEMAKVENKKVIEFIKSLRDKLGREKEVVKTGVSYDEIVSLIKDEYVDNLDRAMKQAARTAGSDSAELTQIVDAIYEKLEKNFDKKQIMAAITRYNYDNIKKNILEKKERPDGRKVDEVRELYVET
jgi:polyribonucleotide nucleotidyltransferase